VPPLQLASHFAISVSLLFISVIETFENEHSVGRDQCQWLELQASDLATSSNNFQARGLFIIFVGVINDPANPLIGEIKLSRCFIQNYGHVDLSMIACACPSPPSKLAQSR
jgi:hypothetical protein